MCSFIDWIFQGPEAVPDRQGVLMFTYEMFARSFGALAFYFRS